MSDKKLHERLLADPSTLSPVAEILLKYILDPSEPERPNRHVYHLEHVSDATQLAPGRIEAVWPEVQAALKGRCDLSYDETIPDGYEKDKLSRVTKHKVQSYDVEELYANPLLFGAVADTHIASRYYAGKGKTGPLWDTYRHFADMGIKNVLHGGNWIDGSARFNQTDISDSGKTAQLEEFVETYPEVPDVTTIFIAGDDHEGWWWQHGGHDIALEASLYAKAIGREDMHFIGYVDADIAILPKADDNGNRLIYNHYRTHKDKSNDIVKAWLPDDGHGHKGKEQLYPYLIPPNITVPHAILRLAHGGGGTAYAKSLRSQKMVSDLEGDKPDILLIGHYHKMIMDVIDNVFAAQIGTHEHQTTFMRKKAIKAEMGAALLGLTQHAGTGRVTSFFSQFMPYIPTGPNFMPDKFSMRRRQRLGMDSYE